MFYAYDDLSWNSSMLGLVMSTYGIAMMLGEFGFSQVSDRLGRKPVMRKSHWYMSGCADLNHGPHGPESRILSTQGYKKQVFKG